MEHTEKCLQHQLELKAWYDEYMRKWPNVCPKCHGQGILTGYENVPYGSTTAAMPVSEDCEECLGQGKCPRCGKTVFTEEDWDKQRLVCSECGWDSDSPDVCPPEGLEEPCECYYKDMNDYQEREERHFK